MVLLEGEETLLRVLSHLASRDGAVASAVSVGLPRLSAPP